MSLDFKAQLLKMLYNGTVDCSAKVGMLVGDDPRFVSDAIVNILSTQLSLSRINTTSVDVPADLHLPRIDFQS